MMLVVMIDDDVYDNAHDNVYTDDDHDDNDGDKFQICMIAGKFQSENSTFSLLCSVCLHCEKLSGGLLWRIFQCTTLPYTCYQL